MRKRRFRKRTYRKKMVFIAADCWIFLAGGPRILPDCTSCWFPNKRVASQDARILTDCTNCCFLNKRLASLDGSTGWLHRITSQNGVTGGTYLDRLHELLFSEQEVGVTGWRRWMKSRPSVPLVSGSCARWRTKVHHRWSSGYGSPFLHRCSSRSHRCHQFLLCVGMRRLSHTIKYYRGRVTKQDLLRNNAQFGPLNVYIYLLIIISRCRKVEERERIGWRVKGREISLKMCAVPFVLWISSRWFLGPFLVK